MKKCYVCKKSKNERDFGKNKAKYDGLSSECKLCKKAKDKEYYQNNKEHIIKVRMKRYNSNKKRENIVSKQYNKKNKAKIAIKKKEYYKKNKNKWVSNAKNNKKRILMNARIRNKYRRDNDINYKLSINLRVRLAKAVRNNQKSGSAIDDLGCSINQLKQYLKTKFYSHPETNEQMTWENYGHKGWHIDHIVPISSFNLSNINELKKACHYINLQPLWAIDNFKKGKKYIVGKEV